MTTTDVIQFLLICVLFFVVFADKAKAEETNWTNVLDTHIRQNQTLLDAIRDVETGGEADPAHAKGDGGKALGHFQMHREFYDDATSLYRSVDWPSYEDACESVVWSERAVVAVWRRYRKSHQWQEWQLCAIFHNGGGAVKGRKTIPDKAYHEKVYKSLLKLKENND